jgi:hypothetical protein
VLTRAARTFLPRPARLLACLPMPRRLTINLTPAAIARLQQRRAAGSSWVVLAAELDVSEGTLRKRLKAQAATSGGVENTPHEVKAHRTSSSVPMRRRPLPLPPRPGSPQPSKKWLRAMLALAARNTPHH